MLALVAHCAILSFVPPVSFPLAQSKPGRLWRDRTLAQSLPLTFPLITPDLCGWLGVVFLGRPLAVRLPDG